MAEDSPIDAVQLDAFVVLKIIKHCKENLPKLVTGQLLGLDIKGVLEVSSCFPFPIQEDEEGPEDEADDVGAEYQMEMMRCLRIVNVDSNTVGWYTSTYLGNFLNLSLIETQFNYQENIKNSVVLVYDPLRTAQGCLSLRAMRLKDSFMALYRTQKFTKASIREAGMSFRDIFQEIPVRLHNSSLVSALLSNLCEDKSMDYNFERLDLSTNPYLEKNIEFLLDSADDLLNEQNRFAFYERQAARQLAQQQAHLYRRQTENDARKASGKDPLPEEDLSSNPLFKPVQHPSRLDSLLIENQIWLYCEQVSSFSGQSFEKMFLAKNMQESAMGKSSLTD